MAALRMLRALLGAPFKPRLGPTDASVIRFRVWPTDVHVRRMSHGSFHILMDIGRYELAARTGLMREVLRRRWSILTAGIVFEAYRGLRVLDSVTLTTRLAWWDDKWVYLEHRFERDGELVAWGLARGLIRAPDRSVPSDEMIRLMGLTAERPPMPEAVARWRDAEIGAPGRGAR